MSWREVVRSLVRAPGHGRGPEELAPRDGPWVEARPDRQLTRDWLPRMRESGWVLPPSLARDDVVPSWTRLGVLDGAVTSTVDSRGLVTIGGADSIDWAIGAEDRWHHPAREANVTQTRVDGAPVVETTLRVPGGTIVHRAFGARAAHYPGGDDWLVVEVENRSAVPVVLAWVVRPFSPTTLSSNRSIDLVPLAGAPQGGTGPLALQVYDPVGLLQRAPSRWARTYDGTDPLHQVEAGEARTGTMPALQGDGSELTGEESLGLVSAAFLTPLPHTAVGRLLLIPGGVDLSAVYDESDGEDDRVRLVWPNDVPAGSAVARGWGALTERGPRVELPDPVLADAVAAARRSLPLCHRVVREPAVSDQVAPPAVHRITTGADGDPAPPGEDMEVLAALAWWGHHDLVDPVLATWPDGQQRGGGFGSLAATAAALRALSAHAIAAGDPGPARAWLPEVGGAIEFLGKALRKPPPGTDLAVAAEGLDAGAVLLARLDQPEAAARVAADAAAARARSSAQAPTSAQASVPADDPDLDAPSTTPRVLAAGAVAAARDGRPSAALWALLRRASATWTWSDPERWDGDDGLVHARLLDAVARLFVDDRPDGLALVPWLPPSWWGRGWEVHEAPTRWGRLSYAVRWHGERPAVLWDLAGGPENGHAPEGLGGAPVITAPGLDPAWSSHDRRGDALLAPVPMPPEVAEGSGDPGGDAADPVTGVAVAAPPRSVWRPTDPGPDAPAATGPAAAPADPDGTPDPGGSFI